MSHAHHNLLGEPPATLLPANPEADAELAEDGLAKRVVEACENLRSTGTTLSK